MDMAPSRQPTSSSSAATIKFEKKNHERTILEKYFAYLFHLK